MKVLRMSIGIMCIFVSILLALILNATYQANPQMYPHFWEPISMMIGPFVLFFFGSTLLADLA